MTSITIDREGFIANILHAQKAPCRVATTGSIVLSGEQTIDGVAVVADDRVLVKNQTNSLNGVMVCKTGDWEFAQDFDQRGHVVQGTWVFVVNGTTTALTTWYVTTTGRPWPGREAITFVQLNTADLAAHLANTADAHDASAISFTPAGNIAATNLQAAIEELDAEKEPLGGLPPGYIYGLSISNNGSDATNDIDIATGKCRSSDDTGDIVLSAAITKRLDAAWAVGTGQGGRDTGSISDGWWYVWAIKRTDTNVVDVLFSLSPTSPTMPTSYTLKRRIAAFHRSTSIRAFTQVSGDPSLFLFSTPVLDLNVSNQGDTAVARTLTVPPNMIALIRVDCLVNSVAVGAAGVLHLRSTHEADGAPATDPEYRSMRASNTDATTAAQVSMAGHFELPVDSSSQIATRSNVTSTVRLTTRGWRDTGAV